MARSTKKRYIIFIFIKFKKHGAETAYGAESVDKCLGCSPQEEWHKIRNSYLPQYGDVMALRNVSYFFK